MKVKKVNVQLH